MDDFFDDCDGMEDGFEDDWGDETEFDGEPAAQDDDFWDGPGEKDWALIFPLAEEISREKREQECARKKSNRDDDDYWTKINRRW